eukprot:3543191-Amphidinium_carterae.1
MCTIAQRKHILGWSSEPAMCVAVAQPEQTPCNANANLFVHMQLVHEEGKDRKHVGNKSISKL